jgi:uncharacterized membrane protein
MDAIQSQEQAVSVGAAQPDPASGRLWEVDALRGIAVCLMVFYHFMFDLYYFGAYTGQMLSGPWQTFARSIGSTFIFVMGISLTLRYNRLKPKMGHRQLFQKYLLRGLQLLGLGMIITAVTYFLIGSGFVIFGILHLLGLSTILAYPFLRSRWASLVAGLIFIGLSVPLSQLLVSDPWLLWLGVRQIGRFMLDFYPVVPWFGVALLGAFVGFVLYPEGGRRFALPNLSHVAPVRGLTYLGQHSLLIYLVHQPVLLGILILVGIGSV